MRHLLSASTLLTVAALSACSNASMMSPSSALEVLAVEPAVGATGVSVSMAATVTFSRAMMTGMEARILLHEGAATGADVAGRGSWSADRRSFTFVPAAPLQPRTTYVLHLAGDMRGADGSGLDHRGCIARGGRGVTAAMMSGYSVGNMMGSGWRSADGAYGMIFTFTTA